MLPKRFLTLSLCCLLLFLTACGGGEEVDTEATIAAAVAETAAAQPTATPVPPTDTPVPPTDTPIPPTETPTPEPPTDTPTPEPTATPELSLDLTTYVKADYGVVLQHPVEWETEVIEDGAPFRFVAITELERIVDEDLSGSVAFVIGVIYDEENFNDYYGELDGLLAKQEAILNDDFSEPAPQSDPILSDGVDGPQVERNYLLIGPEDEELPTRAITIFNEEEKLLGTFLLVHSEEGTESHTPALNAIADSLRLSYNVAADLAEEIARNATPVPTLDPATVSDWPTYEDASGIFTLQYPPTWVLDTDDLAAPFDFLFISDVSALEEDDLSGSLGFVVGQVNNLEDEGWTGNLETLHRLWLADNFPSNYERVGQASVGEVDGVESVSQGYIITNPDDIDLQTKAVTLIQGDNLITLLFIVTKSGEGEYATILDAVEQTLTLNPETATTEESILPADFTLDQSDPVSVVNAIFFAAQTGDYSNLASLCDPSGDNDGDTQAICDITTESDDVDLFSEYFALGQVQGQARVDGDEASVPFTFGPDGTQEETMNLILQDGLWYLYSF